MCMWSHSTASRLASTCLLWLALGSSAVAGSVESGALLSVVFACAQQLVRASVVGDDCVLARLRRGVARKHAGNISWIPFLCFLLLQIRLS
jgi:hypothetical protein